MKIKKRKLKILFLDILTDDGDLRQRVEKKLYKSSTYSEHVRKIFGLHKDEWLTIYANKNKFPRNLSDIDAMILGGSAKDPLRKQSTLWMRNTYKFIKKNIRRDIPILGICGGLQFVIKALGGEIILNPNGREFGTIRVNIRKVDPIFHGISRNFYAQSNHRCTVGRTNFPIRVLASSRLCSIQALAIGKKIRLVQFHPERQQRQTQAIFKMVKYDYYDDTTKSKLAYRRLMKSIKDTSRTNKKIIKNFLKYFVYSHTVS